jgi:alcohol dehydrogenase YqhD (iron-dependent ADH family)
MISKQAKIELEKETLKQFKQLRHEFFKIVIGYAEKTADDQEVAKTEDFFTMLHLTSQFCEMLFHEIHDLIKEAKGGDSRIYSVDLEALVE